MLTRISYWFPGLLFFIPLTLYILTMPPSVDLEDVGEFLTVAYTRGISHPPGYPLYTIFSNLFTFLPFGGLAFRVYLLNSILGSLACIVFYQIGKELWKDKLLSFLVALLMGVGATFWKEAQVAEVYTLNTFFIYLLIYLFLKVKNTGEDKYYYILGFTYGLSLSNVWPLVVLTYSPFLFLAFWEWNKSKKGFRVLFLSVLFVLLGLCPYFYLYFISINGGIDISFLGYPLDSLPKIVSYIKRDFYSELNQDPFRLIDYFRFLGRIFSETIWEITPFGVIYFLAGIYFSFYRLERKIAFAFLLAFLLPPLLVPILVHEYYDPIASYSQVVFQLTFYSMLAFYAGNFVFHLQFRSRKIAIYLLAGLLIVTAVWNFTMNNRKTDSLAFDYAKAILETLPENSNLLLSGDTDNGPLLFAHRVEKIRPDVILHSQKGFFFQDPIIDPLGKDKKARENSLFRYISSRGRVYSSFRITDLGEREKEFFVSYNGLYYQYSYGGSGSFYNQNLLVARAVQVLDSEKLGKYKPMWLKHRNTIISKMCNVILLNSIEHELLKTDVGCQFVYARYLMSQRKHNEAVVILKQLMKSNAPIFMLDKYNIYWSYLESQLRLINDSQVSLEEKYKQLQELVEDVYWVVEELPQCGNEVTKAVLEIANQAPIQIQRAKIKQLYKHCPNLSPLLKN